MEGKDLGTYSYAEHMAAARQGRARSTSSTSTTSARAGRRWSATRSAASRSAKRYEAAGCDLLLCLVNPYKIPHEKVMRSIELLGEHVIPQFG